MINTGKLAGRTLFITGASRGIGKAIALKAAKDGANIVIAAKTAEPHPKLPGTIYTAAKEIEDNGGKALPCVVDVRDESSVKKAISEAVQKFGGIDIVINNASAISLTATPDTDMKRYDLMHNINTRGTFLVSKECLPYLKKSDHAHIINLSPPLLMTPNWFAPHVAYTMAKYGMSMCVLGMAEEFKPYGIGVNALWPRTAISTAAMDMLMGPESAKSSRKPEILADAAYGILCENPKTTTGNFFIDDEILKKFGVTDMKQYLVDPTYEGPLIPDFFVPVPAEESKGYSGPQINEGVGGLGKGKVEANATGGKIEGLFSKIKTTINPQISEKLNALYEFNVTGKEAGVWHIDLRTGNAAAGPGPAPSKPDATLTMDSDKFFDMFSGKLKATTAFMSGKLKISGNLQKAMKLEKLMGSLKSKL